MLRSLTALIGLLLLVFLTACGGSDDSDEPTSGNTSIPSPTSASPSAEPSSSGTSSAPSGASGGASGASPAGSSDGDTPHACTLLTQSEVNELLGEGVEAGEGRDYLATNDDATQCQWDLEAGASYAGALYVEVLGTGASSWFNAANFGNTNPAIDGLGDKAVRGIGGTLDVLQGDYMVSVQLAFFGGQIDKEEAERKVAERVLSKLQ